MLKATNHIPKSRFHVVVISIFMLMIVLLLRFFQIQILEYELYYKKAEVNRIRAIPLNPQRGLILDRRYEIIVDNYPTYILTGIPGEMVNKQANYKVIQMCTNLDSSLLAANYKKYYKSQFFPVRLAKDLTFDQLSKIEEHKSELTGINYQQFPERLFAEDVNLSHAIGYLREVDHSLIKEMGDPDYYSYGDMVGWRGLEKVYEHKLRGKRGVRYVEVDAHGREIGESRIYQTRTAVPGKNLQTTIMLPLQRLIEAKLEGKKVAVIVSKPHTGEILAVVSKPDYPPDLFTGTTTNAEWQAVLNDPDKPLLNRVTNGIYPPGSTLKMITAMLLLDKGKLSFSEEIECNGVYQLGDRGFNCWKEYGHGNVNLKQAIAQSCNIYFYHVVQRVSINDWAAACSAFGFGKETGIDLASESSGLVPTSAYLNQLYGRWGWSIGHLLNLCLGQGEISATPIQMLQYINFLAMNGAISKLHLVKTDQLEIKNINLFKEQTWVKMQEFMSAVLHASYGTGIKANPQIDGLFLGGKTGTAQNPHGDPHAWFVGYGKKGNEIVSMVVLIENGGSGGEVAAPIAGEIFNFLFFENQMTEMAQIQ